MAFAGTERFQLLGKLGEGGMGVVYEAYDRARRMRVALKLLRHLKPRSLYRFKREFRALSDLSHPNVLNLYELFSSGNDWFLTMELVRGVDFLSYIRGAMIPSYGRSGTSLGSNAGMVQTPLTPQLRDRFPSADTDAFLQRHVDGWEGGQHKRDTVYAGIGLPKPPPRRADLGALVDLDRLSSAFGQLAGALYALHRINIIHRDLKPGNIQVTPKGRVVLMDFGVIAELAHPLSETLEHGMIGTPHFMAPEQVLGQMPRAAADWYAFGTMMYLAFTGRLPYEGTREEILHAKLRRSPLSPANFTAGIPRAYERLCMRLLSRDSAERPSSAEILDILEVPAEGRAIGTATGLFERDSFTGRKDELAALHEQVRAVRHGACRCVLVEGLSGMGKSTLVCELVAELGELADGPLVFQGRCHERESLPYKALDGVIDDLCHYLSAMPGTQRLAVIPDDIEAVARVFSVMRRLPECAEKPPLHGVGAVELRRRAMAALREILVKLAREHTLAICIEDLQWIDRESRELLSTLLAAPAPPRLLVIATVRAENLGSGVSPELDALVAELGKTGPGIDRLALGPLAESEQRLLIEKVAPRSLASSLAGERIWQESGGHPMLLIELVRCAEEHPEALSRSLSLDEVLLSRILHFDAESRRLVEILAVAGQPVPAHIVARACGLADEERERSLAALRARHIIRVSHVEDEPWLCLYHDRVRAAVASRLEPEHARAIHRQIAEALEGWDQAPPSLLAHHWLAAGDEIQGAVYLVQAARSAADKLALNHAAELYRQALSCIRNETAEPLIEILRCQAWIGLAEVLRIIDHNDEAMELLQHAHERASRHGLLEELAYIHYLRGSLLFPRGDIEGCLGEHEKARHFARLAGSVDREARALSGLGDAHYMAGRMISAHHYFSSCIALCRMHGMIAIEVANLAMRGMTRYYQNDLEAALADSKEAADAAASVGHSRAEIVARNGCVGWILVEMARLEEAEHEFARALSLARSLGARRFEPNSLTFLGKIAALTGRDAEAQALLESSVAICRETGFSFVGPMALGALALVTRDPAVRQSALREAESILAAGSASHNHLYVCRDAMDACYKGGDAEGIERYAAALERYTRAEPLPWSEFFIDRGRALACYLRGERSDRLAAELARLRRHAEEVGLHLAAQGLPRIW